MIKPVILMGSGGHAKVLAAMLKKLDCPVLGVTGPALAEGGEVFGFPVLGGDNAITNFPPDRIELVNGLGSLPRDQGLRQRLFEQFHARGYAFKTLVDPTAMLADDVVLGEGVQVMAGVIIQSGTQIAYNVIVNSGAIIEHDCSIGCHNHIAPGAVLCGAVITGDNVHIGSGAVVIQGCSLGAGCIVGAGSVLTTSIAGRHIVYPPRSIIKNLERD